MNPSLPKGLTWREDSQLATDNKGRRYAMVPVPRHLEEYRRNFGLQPRNAQVTLAEESAPQSSARGVLPPEAYALLDTISGTESAGKYDIMYGKKRFSSYADHPRQLFSIERGPNKGKKTSAAGRYQFIRDTWDDQASKLGLKDFSPASQDAAAWNLAKETYGRGLMQDLRSGDPAKIAAIGKALRHQWTSLPGGIEAGTNASRFARAYSDNYVRRTGANQMASMPAPPPGFTEVLN
jgi:muramidase (phage lysozyme)